MGVRTGRRPFGTGGLVDEPGLRRSTEDTGVTTYVRLREGVSTP